MIKLPFWLMPGSWGLKGDARKRAEIEYMWADDEYLRLKNLIEFDYKNDPLRKELELLELNATFLEKLDSYQEWGQYEFDRERLNIRLRHKDIDQPTYDTELLSLDKVHNKITDLEYEKRLAQTENRPWVHGELKGNAKDGFYFEMDWNGLFIEYLRDLGFTGLQDEELVDQWLTRMYTNEVIQNEWGIINMDPGVSINTIKRNDGRTEYL